MDGSARDLGFFNIAVGDGNNIAGQAIFDFGGADTGTHDRTGVAIDGDVIADFEVIF